MKIKLWSDLHLEFRDNQFDHIHIPHVDDKETTLLLAGDISIGTESVPFIEEMCKNFKHVLMICGNHEFFENDIYKLREKFKFWELNEGPNNFHFLDNDWRILDGVRFLGGTMWTDFKDGDPLVVGAAHRIMADYEEIRCDGQKITPSFILREHDRFMDFLLQKFEEPFDGSTVVMTHHSPGNVLKRKGRQGNLVDHAYFADIEELIGHHDKAVLWVHGHTHTSYDYMINNTRVICNPFGYWGEQINSDFDPEIIVEV
jgi:hypothetical protein